MTEKMKIALLQLSVVNEKPKNIKKALQTIRDVCKIHHPELVILPECFTGPYEVNSFANHAEPVPNGETCLELSKIAKELQIYLIGGSLIEKDLNGKLYNTCTVWSPEGKLIGKHRKIHLFDMNILPENGGGVSFKESNTLTPGDSFTVVQIKNRKFGIAICHDIRFDELARIYRNEGCDMIVYPSAFCICQGPMHWELLQRARATDNQVFVATVSIARDSTKDYIAYGHSMVVDPWANVLYEASEKEETVVLNIDFSKVDQVRKQMPLFEQRRTDLYNIVKHKN